MFTDPKLGEWAAKARTECRGQDDPYIWANLREFQRGYDRETKVPKKLVQEISKTETEAHGIWAQARKEKRFDIFEPVLTKLIELHTEESKAIDDPKVALRRATR